MTMSDDQPLNRRNFFRQGLRELLRPLAQSAQTLEEAIRQVSALEDEAEMARLARNRPGGAAPAPAPTVRGSATVWLRPPGALPDPQFADTCSRCRACVEVCPAHCIQIDPDGVKGGGVPYIDPNQAACVMCNGLLCMHHCPTGALLPTALGQIDMGTAAWHPESCLRTRAGPSENCTICVEQCPIGEVAIRLDGAGRVTVIEDGCTGCGTCQNQCPTSPKSITVTPRTGAGPVTVARGRR
jgi:ferredoxin-type protein NapG